jgi:S-adenosylmethionine synthetase
MGRECTKVIKSFNRQNGAGKETLNLEVELFTWEKLDRVEDIKKAFNI